MSMFDIQAKAALDMFDALGDTALYRPPGGDPVDCQVIVNENNEPFPSMFENKVIRASKSVSFLRQQVDRPMQDGTVTVTDTGEVIRLGKIVKQNRHVIKVAAS